MRSFCKNLTHTCIFLSSAPLIKKLKDSKIANMFLIVFLHHLILKISFHTQK
ncbi:Hypothetical protein BN2458_PEG0454 [Helicobacter typhlonius]|uniref:Uncharacterized protein n=1 Tax=Helicobacter typhlonius TaxID=76936 RepID=A0A0S4PTG8_9HELI|nr:Hypothetical protein BN2458_PEG0454 [Helicobacter typhlonius]